MTWIEGRGRRHSLDIQNKAIATSGVGMVLQCCSELEQEGWDFGSQGIDVTLNEELHLLDSSLRCTDEGCLPRVCCAVHVRAGLSGIFHWKKSEVFLGSIQDRTVVGYGLSSSHRRKIAVKYSLQLTSVHSFGCENGPTALLVCFLKFCIHFKLKYNHLTFLPSFSSSPSKVPFLQLLPFSNW